MIPIQPWMFKAGAVGVVVLAIFFAGWHVNGKRYQSKIETLKSNYSQCLEQNDRAVEGLKDIQKALERQSEAFDQLESESRRALETQKRINRIALEQERERRSQIINEYEDEVRRLNEAFASLTAAEACHEAWKGLVQ